ncbi:hypothetical protein G7Y79_00041g077940 [Physcia stellaris]|nr:hypothetical protein G7Y79_00041g077940 [Physcia stellaris]
MLRSILYSLLLTPHPIRCPAAAARLPNPSSTLQPPTLNSTSPSIPDPRSLKIATRQLLEHDCGLHITYQYTELLPATLSTVLSRATSEIEANLLRFGDEALVHDDVVVDEDSLLFVAESDRHSPTVELTWGILEEAWRVLRDFLRGRPHPLRVVVAEGWNGRGPRLGEMVLFDYGRRRGGWGLWSRSR